MIGIKQTRADLRCRVIPSLACISIHNNYAYRHLSEKRVLHSRIESVGSFSPWTSNFPTLYSGSNVSSVVDGIAILRAFGMPQTERKLLMSIGERPVIAKTTV